MREFESMHLVKGEDLNHHGTLFAARAAAWLVEAGFAAAACEYGDPGGIVFRGMTDVSFLRPIKKGCVVRFAGRVVHAGRTSLTVHVTAGDTREHAFALEGFLTFVTVDSGTGAKKPHGIALDDPADPAEREAREKAQVLMRRL